MTKSSLLSSVLIDVFLEDLCRFVALSIDVIDASLHLATFGLDDLFDCLGIRVRLGEPGEVISDEVSAGRVERCKSRLF